MCVVTMHIPIHTKLHVYVAICMHVCTYVCMYVCMYVRTYVCMHVYVCTYVCIQLFIYIPVADISWLRTLIVILCATGTVKIIKVCAKLTSSSKVYDDWLKFTLGTVYQWVIDDMHTAHALFHVILQM